MRLIINCQCARNYYNSHALHTNMADACEESSSDCSDIITSNNFSFYAESSSSEGNLQYEEPCTSFSSADKRKSRSEESNSFSKRSAKQKSARKTKQASVNRNFRGEGVSKITLLICENVVARN